MPKLIALRRHRLLDLWLNRRTLAGMKGHFAALFGVSAIASMATIASAHPGHSPTDVAAQLAAPASGADHVMIFGAVSAIAVLVITRVVVYFVQRRNRQTSPVRRR